MPVRARDAGNDDAFHLLILDILDDEGPVKKVWSLCL
jgi:hypothetical protein